MMATDARRVPAALTEALVDYRVEAACSEKITVKRETWLKVIERCYHLDCGPLPVQTRVFGVLNKLIGGGDVVIDVAGSMPGGLQAL